MADEEPEETAGAAPDDTAEAATMDTAETAPTDTVDAPEDVLDERATQRRPHGPGRGVAVYEQHGVAGVALGDMLDGPAPAWPQRVRKL